jgi:hypothetical protein
MSRRKRGTAGQSVSRQLPSSNSDFPKSSRCSDRATRQPHWSRADSTKCIRRSRYATAICNRQRIEPKYECRCDRVRIANSRLTNESQYWQQVKVLVAGVHQHSEQLVRIATILGPFGSRHFRSTEKLQAPQF